MSTVSTEDSNCDEVLTSDDPIGDSYELGGPTDDTVEPEQLDWSTLTVAALKAELAERGLQTTGRKADLVARLEANASGADHSGSELRNDDSKAENEADTSIELHEETGDGEDDIPEDEFVEWNEDAEHEGVDQEGPVDDSKTGDEPIESLKLVEVVDDLKLDIEEQKEGEEVKTSGDKDNEHVEEGDVKKEDGELSVDVHREKDLFYLTWQSKKVTVPFKGEITKDMLTLAKLQTVIIYPIELADLYSDEIKKYAEQAIGVDVQLEDTLPGKPPKGYLKLKLHTYAEAQQAIEALKAYKEGITVKNFSKEDNESHIMSRLRKEDCERRGPIIFRLVYVGNLPADTTEAALREHFPEALQAIIPHNEETLERLGYAYLEFADEKVAGEMSQKYKDAEIDGEKLYVIQAISEKKEKYGLLRDSLRLYWSEQVHRLRKILDRPYSRPQWEISDIEQKLLVLRRRLEKDDRRREILRLPCPNYVEKKDGARASDKTDDNKDQKSSSKPSRSKSREKRRDLKNPPRRSPRRSPPPQRREYRPQRGPVNLPTRREEVADKLVNQLQGLVSALTHKLPTVEPPRPLLDDLQFAPLVSLLDQQRRLGAGSFQSNNLRGTSYGGQSYGDGQGSSRFNSTGKRYQDDDYGNDRKRRMSDFDNSGSGSNRYGSGNTNQGARGSANYSNDRYGARRDNQGGNNSRQQGGRSKWP